MWQLESSMSGRLYWCVNDLSQLLIITLGKKNLHYFKYKLPLPGYSLNIIRIIYQQDRYQ